MAMVCANGPYISIFEFDMKMDDAKLLKIQIDSYYLIFIIVRHNSS